MNALHDISPPRGITLPLPLLAAFLCSFLGSMNGCGKSPLDSSPQAGKVDVLGGPRTKTVMYVLKEGNPFILVDLAPELPNFQGYSSAGQEEYLLKRALMIVAADEVLKRQEYKGKDAFVVRIILLLEKDEYGRPKFGSAPQIALLRVARDVADGLTPQRIAAMTLGEAARAFAGRQLTLSNIPQGTAK